jgi:hypothetical protein
MSIDQAPLIDEFVEDDAVSCSTNAISSSSMPGSK